MKNLLSMGLDGISMGKQGLEYAKAIVELLKLLAVEQRRTNTALVALLAHQERTNDLLEKVYNRRVIAVKESQS